jgi:ribosomal subunit interface protein
MWGIIKTMDIRTKTTDYQITPEVSAYLDEKIAHLGKFLGEDAATARCEVELGRDGHAKHGKNIWFAEMQILHPGGRLIRATNRSESMNGAIDDVKDEVERQLRKDKQLHRRIFRKTGSAIKGFLRINDE